MLCLKMRWVPSTWAQFIFFLQPMCLQGSCVSQTPVMKDSIIRALLHEHTRISKQDVSYSMPSLLGEKRTNRAIRPIALIQRHLSLHRHPCISHSQSPWWVRPDVGDAVTSRLAWPSPPSSWDLTESRINNHVQSRWVPPMKTSGWSEEAVLPKNDTEGETQR